MRRALAALSVVLSAACGLSTTGTQFGGAPGAGGATASSSSGSGESGAAGGAGAGGGAGGDATPAKWWNEEFAHRIKITFDNASRAQALVGFPALVGLDMTNFPYEMAGADGVDLRFLDDNGLTPLTFDIERWVPDGLSLIWVKVPEIDASSSLDHIWLYFGNPAAASAEAPKSTWSSHAGVYHLNNDPSSSPPQIKDSTAGTHQGTMKGGPSDRVPGMIGMGLQIQDGARVDFGDVPAYNVPAASARTVEAWFRAPAEPARSHMIFFKTFNCKGWWVRLTDEGAVEAALSLGTQCAGDKFDLHLLTTPDAGFDDDQWHHVAFAVDRVKSEARLYVDGERVATSQFNDIGGVASGSAVVGDHTLLTQWFDGVLDEVRISSVARSDAWVSATVASARRELAILGPVEDIPAKP